MPETVIRRFVDTIKGAGVVITNDEVLLEALARSAVWIDEFMRYVEIGRGSGVTFYVSAAGVNLQAITNAFVDARIARGDIQRFFGNLREDPTSEIQERFRARAES